MVALFLLASCAKTADVSPAPEAASTEAEVQLDPSQALVVLKGADGLALRGEDGTEFGPGPVPPGAYAAEADFGGTKAGLGKVSLKAGQKHVFLCDSTFMACGMHAADARAPALEAWEGPQGEATVVVNNADGHYWMDADGNKATGNTLPAGSHALVADFGTGYSQISIFTFEAGSHWIVTCDGGFMSCRGKEAPESAPPPPDAPAPKEGNASVSVEGAETYHWEDMGGSKHTGASLAPGRYVLIVDFGTGPQKVGEFNLRPGSQRTVTCDAAFMSCQ
jgi:hypothetical protein